MPQPSSARHLLQRASLLERRAREGEDDIRRGEARSHPRPAWGPVSGCSTSPLLGTPMLRMSFREGGLKLT